MGDKYLKSFKKDSSDLTKYFNLIINLHLIDGSDLGFLDANGYSNFKVEITKLAYQLLVDKELIKDYNMGALRFSALCSVLVGLNKLRMQDPEYLSKNAGQRNPKAFYTYSDLSERLSSKNYRQLLMEQLEKDTPSYQLEDIKKDLKIGVKKNIKECSVAINDVNIYLKKEKKTNSRIGNVIHPLYEKITIEYLRSKDIEVPMRY